MRMRYRISYGYSLKNGRLEIAEEQAETVRFIFEEYLNGKSMLKIVAVLNEKNIPPLNQAQWQKSTVSRILSNSRYTGDDGYPQILDEKIFSAVQEKRQRTAAVTGKDKTYSSRQYAYYEKIICGECGEFYRHFSLRNKKRWICFNKNDKRKNGVGCDNSRTFSCEDIEEMFVGLVNRLVTGEIKINRFIKAHNHQTDEIKERYSKMEAEKRQSEYTPESIIDLIYEIAQGEFSARESADYDILKLKIPKKKISEFDAELFKSIVKRIVVYKETVEFELITGQKITC